jgi:hypothetical protein
MRRLADLFMDVTIFLTVVGITVRVLNFVLDCYR